MIAPVKWAGWHRRRYPFRLRLASSCRCHSIGSITARPSLAETCWSFEPRSPVHPAASRDRGLFYSPLPVECRWPANYYAVEIRVVGYGHNLDGASVEPELFVVEFRLVLWTGPGAGFVNWSHCSLLKLGFLTNSMHLLYALVKRCSFSKARGFLKATPGVVSVLVCFLYSPTFRWIMQNHFIYWHAGTSMLHLQLNDLHEINRWSYRLNCKRKRHPWTQNDWPKP